MPKRKIRISDKMFGIMIGIALTISAIGVINAVSISYAHDRDANSMMMNGDSGMDDMMGCMKIMSQAMDDGEITQDEMEEVMGQMDQDGDGLCDYCGMSVEACKRMISS